MPTVFLVPFDGWLSRLSNSSAISIVQNCVVIIKICPVDMVHQTCRRIFCWCRVFTSLTPLVFGAGGTYGLLVLKTYNCTPPPPPPPPPPTSSSCYTATLQRFQLSASAAALVVAGIGSLGAGSGRRALGNVQEPARNASGAISHGKVPTCLTRHRWKWGNVTRHRWGNVCHPFGTLQHFDDVAGVGQTPHDDGGDAEGDGELPGAPVDHDGEDDAEAED